jgi:hypothetical protein
MIVDKILLFSSVLCALVVIVVTVRAIRPSRETCRSCGYLIKKMEMCPECGLSVERAIAIGTRRRGCVIATSLLLCIVFSIGSWCTSRWPTRVPDLVLAYFAGVDPVCGVGDKPLLEELLRRRVVGRFSDSAFEVYVRRFMSALIRQQRLVHTRGVWPNNEHVRISVCSTQELWPIAGSKIEILLMDKTLVAERSPLLLHGSGEDFSPLWQDDTLPINDTFIINNSIPFEVQICEQNNNKIIYKKLFNLPILRKPQSVLAPVDVPLERYLQISARAIEGSVVVNIAPSPSSVSDIALGLQLRVLQNDNMIGSIHYFRNWHDWCGRPRTRGDIVLIPISEANSNQSLVLEIVGDEKKSLLDWDKSAYWNGIDRIFIENN